MAWRGLSLSEPCRLRLADGQCVILREDGEIRLPLEDLAWILIDTPEVTLTSALLAACMEAGIALIVTDARHLPSGLALPFHRHYRQGEIAALQAGLAPAKRERLWQALVEAKVRNQAALLSRCAGRAAAAPLLAMISRLGAAEATAVEARAARHYWSRLFPSFTREDGRDLRNAMLNYGYAVMRGVVARALVAAGLLPALGLHHAGALNPFNLADDLLEPFRPVVDAVVWDLAGRGRRREGELERAHRQRLAGVAFAEVRLGGERVTAMVAAEKAAEGLVRAIAHKGRGAAGLVLPELPEGGA
jgi:CRISPR-associated protein Cas1